MGLVSVGDHDFDYSVTPKGPLGTESMGLVSVGVVDSTSPRVGGSFIYGTYSTRRRRRSRLDYTVGCRVLLSRN